MSSETLASVRGNNQNPPELSIILIGGRHENKPSGKSSVGNIILGRGVFETNRRTSKSVMRQEEVSGRLVSVVDTPGWMSSYPLDLTPKLTQLEIQQSVHLCPPPGPHAFVLVMPLDSTYVGAGRSVEEHVGLLLSDRVWRHAIVVFTVADENKMRSVRDLIRSDHELRHITEKCEGRFHVLNIANRGGLLQQIEQTELLQKIDQMVTSNGGHYETEKHISEELKEKERSIRRRAEQRKADAQNKTGLPKYIGLTNLRILLLGRQWSGKSSAGNTILRGSVFKSGQARLVNCGIGHAEVTGRHLTLVDSSGWYYNSQLQDTSEMDKLDIQNSVHLCPPGPHAVLLMVPVDQAFTKAQKVAVEEHMTLLSQEVWSHAIVLFACGDWLGDTSIEQHIEAEGEDLRWLVHKCGNRYHVFNNEKLTETLWKEFKTQSKLTECVRQQSQVDGRNVSVVNSPDWSTTPPPSQKIKDVLLHGVTMCSPGPHAVLLTVNVRSAFSEADRRSVEEHMELLGDRVWRHTLVLFTWGFWLGDRRVEEYIVSEGEPLRWLLEKCGYRYHVLHFLKWNISEVTGLMEKIEDMAMRNRGHFVPLDPREDRSVRDAGHFTVGDGARQMTLFEAKKTFTAEEWNRREEEWKKKEEELRRRIEEEWKKREEQMIERMLKFVAMEEEPTLPVAKKRNSMVYIPPFMSGETPSETGSSYHWSPDKKVSDWLQKGHRGTTASSSGVYTLSEADNLTGSDVMRDVS